MAKTYRVDLTGNVYDDVTVLKWDKEKSTISRDNYWVCKCKCGEIKIISGSNLSRGSGTNCNCIARGNLIGRVYEDVTVIGLDKERTEKSSKSKYWFGRCKCGTIKSFSGSSLRKGSGTRCGSKSCIIPRNEFHHIDNNTTIIYLNDMSECFIDRDMHDYIKDYRWNIGSTGYARGQINGKEVGMHRFIMNVYDSSIYVDHIDGNKLNNMRYNLRISIPQNRNIICEYLDDDTPLQFAMAKIK